MSVLLFGEAEPGRDYQPRKAAFGVVERDGLIAVAAITVHPGEAPVFDLPGGGIDPGESETQAMVREFGEETGLIVEAGDFLLHARQRFVNPEGRTVDNHGSFYTGRVVGENPALKIEDNHELVWLRPEDFIRRARHEAQAWAVCAWWRKGNSARQ